MDRSKKERAFNHGDRVRRFLPVLLQFVCTVIAFNSAAATAPTIPPGVMVLSVEPNGVAASLGVRAGDRIERYGERNAPSISAVLSDEDAWGRVRAATLTLERSSGAATVSLPPGERGWLLAPDLPAELRTRVDTLLRPDAAVPSAPDTVEQLSQQIEAAAGNEARLWWRAALAAAWRRGRHDDEAEKQSQALERESNGQAPFSRRARLVLALIHADRGEHEAAERWFDAALEAARAEPFPCRIAVLLARARYEHDKGDLPAGEARLSEASALLPIDLRESLLATDLLATEGILAWRQAQLDRYRSASDRLLALRTKLVPESLDQFRALMAVGDLQWALGQLDAAMTSYQHCLTIAQRLAPGGIDEARTYTLFGKVQWQRGDFMAARASFERSRELQEKVAPGTLDLAWSYNNLGVTALVLGNLPESRRRHFDALAIRERLFPGSPSVAYSLLNLGEVLIAQGDAEGAREHLESALVVAEKLNPEGLDTALCLFDLGLTAQLRGDLHEARRLHLRSLALREKLAPKNEHALQSHRELGWVELALGDPAAAENHFKRAQEIQQQLAPKSPELAMSTDGLAAVALQRGDLQRAQRDAERALAQASTDPTGLIAAPIEYRLGRIAESGDKLNEARRHFGNAVAALERERFSVGGLTARSYFGGQAALYHHAVIESAVAAGDLRGAFEALERSRARGAIELMSESAIDWRPLLPEPLRQRIDALRLARKQLSGDGSQPATPERGTQLARLEHEQESLLDEVRRAVPSLASIVYPEPLSFSRLEAALPEGALLLAYSIGERESTLLAMRHVSGRPVELLGRSLALDAATLAKRVELLRGLVTDPASGDGWRSASEALAHDLIDPVADWLETSMRLIVVPDGALHRLPLAVLVPRSGKPLAASIPITIVPSMTLFESLRKAGLESSDTVWAGVGDPVYGDTVPPGSPLRRDRGTLAPLPGTREELERVDSLLAGGHRLLLGAEATEEAAMKQLGDARLVHFACHTALNDRFPLRSGLLLSAPLEANKEDGLLQAWEILDALRLQSELVVLSSCDTASGEVQGGEGLIGLGRAFFAAGARSLLVSQWSLGDASTPRLIESFYRGLAAGEPRDLALQQAQRESLDDPAHAHPYYWGAFQLVGRYESIEGLERATWIRSLGSSGTIAAIAAVILTVGAAALLWSRRASAGGTRRSS